MQWGLRCWPEDGKYKCLETAMTAAETNRIDVFLSHQLGSELKLQSVLTLIIVRVSEDLIET